MILITESVLPARLENNLLDPNDCRVEKLGRHLGIQKIISASRNTLIGPSRDIAFVILIFGHRIV